MNQQQLVTAHIEKRIEDYTRRFFSPSPATVRKWTRQIKRDLDNKNQLPLPLNFTEEQS